MRRDGEGHVNIVTGRQLHRPQNKLGKPMSTKTDSLEASFLDHVCEQNLALTIFLVNGVKLQGTITWVDATSMLLSRDGHSQLVYKNAISTIMPNSPVEIAVA
jgi:host factor-I protein